MQLKLGRENLTWKLPTYDYKVYTHIPNTCNKICTHELPIPRSHAVLLMSHIWVNFYYPFGRKIVNVPSLLLWQFDPISWLSLLWQYFYGLIGWSAHCVLKMLNITYLTCLYYPLLYVQYTDHDFIKWSNKDVLIIYL